MDFFHFSFKLTYSKEPCVLLSSLSISVLSYFKISSKLLGQMKTDCWNVTFVDLIAPWMILDKMYWKSKMDAIWKQSSNMDHMGNYIKDFFQNLQAWLNRTWMIIERLSKIFFSWSKFNFYNQVSGTGTHLVHIDEENNYFVHFTTTF